jgi:hypothetical protein
MNVFQYCTMNGKNLRDSLCFLRMVLSNIKYLVGTCGDYTESTENLLFAVVLNKKYKVEIL